MNIHSSSSSKSKRSHAPKSFFDKQVWALFIVLIFCFVGSPNSIITGLWPLLRTVSPANTPANESADDTTQVVLGVFAAFENGWYYHLGVFIPATCLAALAFRKFTNIYFRYCWFVLSLFISMAGAFGFFYLEVLADILKDSDKTSHVGEIAVAKLCSLIIAVFSVGLSFEIWKKLFFELPEDDSESV